MKLSVDVQKKEDSIFVNKGEGTSVNYFLYPEFEIHLNSILPGTIQGWHSHTIVEEVIVVTQGSFIVESVVNHQLLSVAIEKGDVVRVNNSIHRLINQKEESAEFSVFRFVPRGENTQEKIKQDKVEYSEKQIQRLLAK